MRNETIFITIHGISKGQEAILSELDKVIADYLMKNRIDYKKFEIQRTWNKVDEV